MRLKRVQIPNFRVLKDIDITFEDYYTPQIFPLASQNGGGKSTFLQLIFTLFNCCLDKDNNHFLRNMLNGFPVDQLLARFYFTTFLYDDLIIEFRSQRNSDNMKSVCQYKDFNSESSVLFCNMRKKSINTNDYEDENMASARVELTLKDIGKSVFLAASITQPFRFIDPSVRSLAFRKVEPGDYYQNIEESRTKLPNFFAHDFVVINTLIEAFLKVRDDDFRSAIITGNYGNSYQQMLKDLEEMLGDKKVNIDPDLNEITFFKQDSNGNMIKLYPDDLSHGELKRLSLFVWLKYNKIENSIVLMDEIEIALHPDWQYQIVRDLEAWEPSNQYILATHSYDICSALSPSHVKEIEPKLLKSETKLAE
jgi:predicted ATP-dependent endonuclease of OLD family